MAAHRRAFVCAPQQSRLDKRLKQAHFRAVLLRRTKADFSEAVSPKSHPEGFPR
jgi:hypothetical protein